MNKLYLATQSGDTMFVSSNTDTVQLAKEARECFKSEGRSMVDSQILVTEVYSLEQVPEDWCKGDLYVWGTGDETTPVQWLNRYNNPEYQEYLRLKAIFE